MPSLLLETYLSLLKDTNHWAFELTLMLLFDVLIGALVWPYITRHIHRDVASAETHDHELIEQLKNRVDEYDRKQLSLGVATENGYYIGYHAALREIKDA
jgi:hypothetical protein